MVRSKEGVPVTYREITVGKVTGYELGQTADRVLIHILIEPKYAALVRSGSRFWNTSGFGLDFGLFKGATVRTESLETLVAGGIAFATPDGERMGNAARPQQTFPLFDKFEDEWLTWAPEDSAGQVGRGAAIAGKPPPQMSAFLQDKRGHLWRGLARDEALKNTTKPQPTKKAAIHKIAAFWHFTAERQTSSNSGSSACTVTVAFTASWRRMYFQSASSM